MSEHHSHPVLPRTLGALLVPLAMIGLVAQAPLSAVTSSGGTPAAPVPSARWSSSPSLQPDTIIGDTTSFTGHADPHDGNTLFYNALDIEGDYLFTATGQGMEVIDLSPATGPFVRSYIYGWISGSAFPIWNYSDKDWYIKQIDAPEGDTSVVTLGMEEQGFAIVRTTDPSNAVVAYQREEPTSAVYAFTSGGTKYGYGQSYSNGAIHLYNLSASANLTKCAEHPPATGCGSVYMGQVTAFGTGWSSMAGTGTFLATGKAGRGGSVSIWNVATPGAPSQVFSLPANGTPTVALWKAGGSYYLAKLDITGKILSIYNVSCISSGSCPNSPSPVWSGTVSATLMQYVTASVDGAKSYLYIGADDLATCAPQREYIYDVTTPASPTEITPKVHADGYWGWYYMNCTGTGYNLVGPRIGKVSGGKLYRAAMSILDSHKIGQSGPPVAGFSWTETEIYPGTAVHFQDQSSGAPTVWMWTFADGSSSNPASQNPTVAFSTFGDKAVTLTVRNAVGEQSAPLSQTVHVLDPTPGLGGVTVSPANPTVCQPVTLTAVNAKGAPALTYDFAVLNVDSVPVASSKGAAASYVWSTGATTSSGSYTARLTLSNGSGSVTATAPFTLAGLTPLPLAGQFAPTNDAFTNGTVKFHVNVAGASEWSWDFDDDNNPSVTTFTPWSSDPVNGPNPAHTYTSTNLTSPRQVVVKVKNCVTGEVASAALPITITVTTPLKAQFVPQCPGGFCAISANFDLPFSDASTGAEFWDYDWDGNNSYEDAGNTAPRVSHVYTTQGTYHPKLRVRRGTSEQDVYPAPGNEITIIVGTANLPSISISGPTSGAVNANLAFSATASSCTPNSGGDPSGWSWSAPGATITGGPASEVTISWTGAGSKTVTVTNSGCGSASGSKSVAITGGDTGGALKAIWSFSPAEPINGQAVGFNGSTSTGSPTGWTWDFGDGTGFGTGAQVNHTFAVAGTYNVQLTVTKPGNCPPAPFCENSLVKTVVVKSGEAPLLPKFTNNATCISEGGLNVCTAAPGQSVAFDDASTGGPVSWSWDFGDGETATGKNVTHAFKKAGSYNVVLTIARASGTSASTSPLTFNIVGTPPPTTSTTVLPWIAQSRGTLEQSSDLYVHNPGTVDMEIVLEFRKRGTPETNPPKATRTIAPGATLYVADVLKELFNWENIVGFVTVTRTKGDADPVMTSFNTTYKDGSQFGQTIPGFSFNQDGSTATAAPRLQYLVGLNDNSEREAYFGITNPNSGPATYRLSFFDALGRAIGTPSADFKLSSYGLKQFQPAEIRSLFGINTQDDYRVEVETVSGGQIFPYGANVRTASDDPSFLGVGTSSTPKLYLIGALSTPGINDSLWQTDVVLANTGPQVALTDVTFTKAGLNDPTPALKVTLQPGETRRLENLIASQWNIKDSVGVVTLASDSQTSVFPIVQGESYNNANPAMRFGQFMAAFRDSDAAGPGETHYLVGLRQDTNSRTTFWIFNPSAQQASYDVIYRALDGTELGRIAGGVLLGPGKLRQFSPSQHALPATVPGGGFTVQVVVHVGKVLAAAQVVNNQTNDPAYVQGQAQ
jgi:PKD repeat protein